MRKSSLLIIFMIVFIDLVGFGIVIPILPYYAQSFGANGWVLGWLMTSYSLMQFLFAPVWGRLSDKIGRRPVLLFSLLGTSAGLAVLGFADSLAWLFAGRIFAGICGANISTAYAYVSDVTTEENRAKGMGMVGAGFGLGFIFGPAIGGLLSHYGYGAPMLVGSAMALANCVFAFFKLEEPPISTEQRAQHRVKRFDLAGIRLALSDTRTRFAVGIFLMLTFAVTQMEVTFAMFLKARYEYDAQHAGMLLALIGLIMAGVQGGLIGKLARRFGQPRLIIAGNITCAIALFAFAMTSSIQGIVASLIALGLGHGVLHPSLSSLASFGASADRRGATMGVFQSAGSLARVVGPPCAGWLYDQVSLNSPFISGSMILAAAALISLLWWRSQAPLEASV